jgi:hypothetical protein
MHCRRLRRGKTFETVKKKQGFSEIKGMLEILYYSEHHTERKESCITYHASFRRKYHFYDMCTRFAHDLRYVHVLRASTRCELHQPSITIYRCTKPILMGSTFYIEQKC